MTRPTRGSALVVVLVLMSGLGALALAAAAAAMTALALAGHQQMAQNAFEAAESGITVALLAALRTSKKPGAVLGALAFVGACTALDRWTAGRLDEETGEAFPLDKGELDMSKR